MTDHDSTSADLPEIYTLESIEQLRALADELRVRIFRVLTQRPLTATQLGDELGIAAPKAHYHVRELERVGLVRLVETRERGGILEKYFRAVARDVQISHALLRRTPDEALTAIRDLLQTIERGFSSALARALAAEESGGPFILLDNTPVWATNDEMRDLTRRMDEMIQPYQAPRAGEGVRPRMLVVMGYDAGAGDAVPPTEDEPSQVAPAPGDMRPVEAPPGEISPGGAPRVRRVTVAGVVSYARRDLERAVAVGEALDIIAVGTLAFADDVPPELADRAIFRLRVRGKLAAAPEVRVVLERKQQRPQPREEA
jgi:DNA-binding transcriptional ArsR family regulator